MVWGFIGAASLRCDIGRVGRGVGRSVGRGVSKTFSSVSWRLATGELLE